jgi:hypothetical protein
MISLMIFFLILPGAYFVRPDLIHRWLSLPPCFACFSQGFSLFQSLGTSNQEIEAGGGRRKPKRTHLSSQHAAISTRSGPSSQWESSSPSCYFLQSDALRLMSVIISRRWPDCGKRWRSGRGS